MKNATSIYGTLYGVAVGDALGAPLEFMDQEQIKAEHGSVTGMIGGGWLNVEPGEITDDTQMTIAVAEGILENPHKPIEAIGKRFIKWYESRPKDIGGTCRGSIVRAINNAESSGREYPSVEDWESAAICTHKSMGGRSAGNGSLMRTAYVGAYYSKNVDIFGHASFISGMTHYDQEAGMACVAYSFLIDALIKNPERKTLIEALEGAKQFIPYYDYEKLTSSGFKPKPTGYVVDSFEVALHCILTTDLFKAAVIKAVNLGGDADTIGAITGGIAGALYGYSAIPRDWKESLSWDVRKKLDDLSEAAEKARAAREP